MFEFNTYDDNDNEILVSVYSVTLKEPDIHADNPDDFYGYVDFDYEVFCENGEPCEDYDSNKIEEEILKHYKQSQEDAAYDYGREMWEERNGIV